MALAAGVVGPPVPKEPGRGVSLGRPRASSHDTLDFLDGPWTEREVSHAILRDDDDVLQANAAESSEVGQALDVEKCSFSRIGECRLEEGVDEVTWRRDKPSLRSEDDATHSRARP